MAKVLELVNQGTIGELIHIQADFGFLPPYEPEKRIFNPELAGGSLLDIGIYPLFISKLLLGNPAQIRAVATFAPTGVDRNCAMALSYKNGATATLFSTVGTVTDTSATIYGSLGKIHIHSRFHETKHLTLTLHDQTSQEIPTERLGWGYSYEATDAQRCLEAGLTENDKWPLQQTIELMALLDDVRHQCGIAYPFE
jgi:predicted dehydrogenase